MKSKKAYLFTILVILVISLANFPLLNTLRKQVKRTVKTHILKKSIDRSEIQTFKINQLKDAIWVEPHEFILNDQMYDVLEKIEKDGITYFHCYKDSNENKVRKLQEYIAAVFKKNQPKTLEIGVAKVIFHPSQNYFGEYLTQEQLWFRKTVFIKAKLFQIIPITPDFYFKKLKVPPEIYR